MAMDILINVALHIGFFFFFVFSFFFIYYNYNARLSTNKVGVRCMHVINAVLQYSYIISWSQQFLKLE